MADREGWHLEDEALLARLDRLLEGAAGLEAEAHLAVCSECRDRERRWARLFAQIDRAREIADPPELAQAVLSRIRTRLQPARGVRALLFGEIALALAAMAVLGDRGWSVFESLAGLPRLPDLGRMAAPWVAGMLAAVQPAFEWPHALQRLMPDFQLPPLDLPLVSWGALIGGALMFGLIGNGLLLRFKDGAGQAGRHPGGR